jgi:hypothetical protein
MFHFMDRNFCCALQACRIGLWRETLLCVNIMVIFLPYLCNHDVCTATQCLAAIIHYGLYWINHKFETIGSGTYIINTLTCSVINVSFVTRVQ